MRVGAARSSEREMTTGITWRDCPPSPVRPAEVPPPASLPPPVDPAAQAPQLYPRAPQEPTDLPVGPTPALAARRPSPDPPRRWHHQIGPVARIPPPIVSEPHPGPGP